MKKLKNKVFITVIIIFTTFITLILFAYNYQIYERESDNIKDSLLRISNPTQPSDLNKRIFMDYDVYTILLDENNKVIQYIGHNETGIINDDIEIITKSIVTNNENIMYIGNLYTNKYAYCFTNNKSLVIVDTTKVNNYLKSTLDSTIVLFVSLELIAFLLSVYITRWITKPALESYNKQKNFIMDASHELKTPIAVIMTNADALENDINNKKWLNNIKNETTKMSELVTNLLDLSKLENTNDKTNYKLIDLSKLINKNVLTLESLAYENKVSLKCNIKENIKFKCNEKEIGQVITILLDNAIKHSYKNKEVEVSLDKIKDQIIIKVINNGKEIPKGEEEKIFERFYRVDKARNRNENRYGLGLAIAKAIVNNHDGIIKANSKKNFTTFEINFKNK